MSRSARYGRKGDHYKPHRRAHVVLALAADEQIGLPGAGLRQRRGISFPRPRRSCGWLEDQRRAAEIIVEIGQRELDSLDRGGAGIGELNSEMILADSRRRDADAWSKRQRVQAAIY